MFQGMEKPAYVSNLQKLCIVNIDDASANEDWDRQTMCCSVCAECLLVAMMAFVLFT